MTRIARRSLAKLGLSAGFISVLAGCATVEKYLSTTTPAQWASDIASVASWGPQVIAEMGAFGINAATIAKVQALFTTVQSDATQVATATAAVVAGTSMATYVQEAVQTIAAIANILMPLFPVTAPLVAVVDAFLALVPIITAALGITGAPLNVPKPHVVYSPEQARALLSVPHTSVALTAPQARAILAVPH